MTSPTQASQQVPSDEQIIEFSKDFGEYRESIWGTDMNPTLQFHSTEIAIVKMVRALLAQSTTAATEDAQDAKRYRHMRAGATSRWNRQPTDAEFDAMIDSALSKGDSHE